MKVQTRHSGLKIVPCRASQSASGILAIVALWFAALLGLGSIVLPIALLERLVALTGIAAFVPSAEPPLGFTARVIIALAGVIGGAAIGLLLARKVARTHDLARIETRECRPISAHDELGEEGLGSPDSAPAGHKRRSDALRRHVQPAEDHLSMQDQTMTEGQDFPRPFDEDHAERLDYQPFAPPTAEEEQGQPSPDPQEPGPAADPLAFSAPSRNRNAEPPAPRLSVVEPGGFAAELQCPVDDRPIEEFGLVQLAERLGAAIEKRRVLKASQSAARPSEPTLDAPKDFGVAAPEDATRAIADFFGPDEAVTANSPMQAEPEAEPVRPAVPASMCTLPIDEEDGEDEDVFAASLSLPIGGIGGGFDRSAAESFDEDYEPEDEPEDDGDYSSLLAMKNPFTRQEEFVQVDEPEDENGAFEPAATSPSAALSEAAQAPAAAPVQGEPLDPSRFSDPTEEPTDSAARAAAPGAPHDPGVADRDLRSALAILQRMGGGA